jgi:hypothetical protein
VPGERGGRDEQRDALGALGLLMVGGMAFDEFERRIRDLTARETRRLSGDVIRIEALAVLDARRDGRLSEDGAVSELMLIYKRNADLDVRPAESSEEYAAWREWWVGEGSLRVRTMLYEDWEPAAAFTDDRYTEALGGALYRDASIDRLASLLKGFRQALKLDADDPADQAVARRLDEHFGNRRYER